MKKRGLLLLLIIMIPSSLAMLTEELYDETIIGTQTIDISGTEFTFTVLSDINQVNIEWDGSSMILDGYVEGLNDTTTTSCDQKEGYYICVGEITFSYVNTTTKVRYYSTPVEVKKIITEVDMTREIDNTDLLIGQQFTVKTTLENTGTIEATDVEFTDYFPDSFAMNSAEVEVCKISGSSISFKGTLAVNQKKECKYKLTTLKGISYDSKATLSYYNGNEKIETEDEIEINVANYSIDIGETINRSNINIGDDFLLTLEIKNINDAQDITPTLNIQFPSRLKIIKKTGGIRKVISNKYKWNGEIPAGEYETLEIAFKADYFGDFNITYDAQYRTDGLDRKINGNIDVNVIKPEMTINIDAPSEIEQNKESKIRVKILNENEQSFDKINIRSDNDLNLTNIEKTINNLDSAESFLVLDADFIAPSVDKDTIFYYNLTLTYKTENGQSIIAKKSIPIEVKTYFQEETPLKQDEGETIQEKTIPEETPQEKEAIAQEIVYEEEEESFYTLYKSMLIKIIIFIAIFFSIYYVIRFMRKKKEHEFKLRREEEINEGTYDPEKTEPEEETKEEIKKEEKPKENPEPLKDVQISSKESDVPEPPKKETPTPLKQSDVPEPPKK